VGSKKNRKIFFDGLGGKKRQILALDYPLSRFVLKYKNSSVLFSPLGKTESFFTSDSNLYFTPEELRSFRKGERIVRITNRLDSLAARAFREAGSGSAIRTNRIFRTLEAKYADFRERLEISLRDSAQNMSLARAYNASIVAAVIFGMLLMTMIYRNLGQGVSAKVESAKLAQNEEAAKILGATTENLDYEIDDETITRLFREYDSEEDLKFQKEQFAKEIKEIVKGYPIEKMVPHIAEKDRIVAAFIVAIARKESSWGKRVPVYKGQDCFNYWGWIGKNRVGSGGHTCFANPQEAVDTVAKRIEFLVSSKKLNTPQKMIIWKCGDCSWDTPAAMRSWIDDVDLYFRKLNKT
jgi:hypothetical protein